MDDLGETVAVKPYPDKCFLYNFFPFLFTVGILIEEMEKLLVIGLKDGCKGLLVPFCYIG